MILLFACSTPPDDPLSKVAWAPDEVPEWVDGPDGRVRVHFTATGEDAVDDIDADGDGLADLPYTLARNAESALDFYQFEGFADPTGWSGDRVDVYVATPVRPVAGYMHPVCDEAECDSYVVLHPDAADRVTPIAHELFHLVQAPYGVGEPAWLIEGMADNEAAHFTGAELLLSESQAYLDHAHQALDAARRPTGAAYGAALLWEYLGASVSPDIVREALEASITLRGTQALDAALALHDTSLAEQWPGFAAANLKTGDRWDGGSPYGADAQHLTGITATAEGAAIHGTWTFPPLSARYFRVDQAPGTLWLATAGAGDPLTVTVHAVEGGWGDGETTDSGGPWGLPSRGSLDVGFFQTGGVWLSIGNPSATQARTVELCIGDESAVVPCEGCGGESASVVLFGGIVGLGRRRPRRR